MNLTINSLPARTWNRLGMNEANVTAEGDYHNHTPLVPYIPEDAEWNPAASDVPSGAPTELDALTASADTSLVRAAADTVMYEPLVLHYTYEAGEKAASRLVLHAEKGSIMHVILVLKSPDEHADIALQTEIYAEDGAEVHLYTAQLLGADSVCMNHISAVCEDQASFDLVRLELGAGKLYSGVRVDLKGEESDFHTAVGYHVRTGQMLDMNYNAVHRGCRSTSLIEVSGTLEENSRKIFRGTIDLQRGARGAKGTESENVLLLGENMVNQTIPLILCQEDDVEGNHGASIGRLDDKVLFYLGSRGISEEAAQQIIAEARIESICAEIPDESVQEEVHAFEATGGISHEEEL